jgi:hypothetical protein
MIEFEFNQKTDTQETAPAQTQPIPNQNDFVSKKDFEEVRGMLTELYKELKG